MVYELICKSKYDPFYGFNIIKVGQKVFIDADESEQTYIMFEISLKNEQGQLIGKIWNTDLYKFFRN